MEFSVLALSIWGKVMRLKTILHRRSLAAIFTLPASPKHLIHVVMAASELGNVRRGIISNHGQNTNLQQLVQWSILATVRIT